VFFSVAPVPTTRVAGAPCFRAMMEEPGMAACATDFLAASSQPVIPAIPASRIARATTWLFGVIQLW